MSFVIQRVAGRKISLSEIRTTVLRIGRGTNSELRSDNPAVALEHAIIETDSAGYAITDKGSITGTYLNGKPIESARLTKGDLIEVGDLRVEVQVADADKPLFLRIVTRDKAAAASDAVEDEPAVVAGKAADGAVVRAEKVDYAEAFRLKRPWMTKASLVAAGLIVTLAVIGEVTRPENQKAFMPGGVSSAHAIARDEDGNSIADNCAACHDPWRGVRNERCETCHKRVVHAENELETPACTSCHSEHRGLARLTLVSDSTCTACHAALDEHVKTPLSRAAIASVTAFGTNHPEFATPPDPNNIRFNHNVHLKPGGLANATGRREQLNCQDCHKLVVTRGKADPVATNFEQHCQRCHRLTFDARFPDAEIPHGGDPQLAYGYIATTYAGNRDIIGRPPDEVRRLLTRRAVTGLGEQAVINAAQVVRVKCGKCHELQQAAPGRLTVQPPVLVTKWLKGAGFTHTAHSGLECESCHRGLRESTKTADVHMPAQKDCISCHGEGATTPTTCATCHEYHVASKPILAAAAAAPAAGPTPGSPRGETRMLDTILLIVITALVLVVLVPVGIALFARLKPKFERAAPAPAAPVAPPPARATPAPPAPAAPSASGRAAAQPATSSRAPEPPAAPPPQTAPMEATRIGNLSEMQSPPAGGATQFIEWHGMLLCTSGPLEGQRFLIEEAGLYIGRDASMAQVVINDSRISKRHVRIVPRGGGVWAVDEGSTNGTFIGKPAQRITEVQLKRGDTIVLADNAASFLYQI